MRNIFFLFLTICVFCGCSSSRPPVRVIIGGNIDGKILRIEEKTAGVMGTLARVGGLIEKRTDEFKYPTVLIQTGNTIVVDNQGRLVKAKLLAEAAMMLGFQANLPSTHEFNDTPEFAKARDSFGWPQVVSNIKPKEGIEPPVQYETYFKVSPPRANFVYFVNFVSKDRYDKSKLLNQNYDWITPSEFIKDFARKIRPKDLIVAYYQTDNRDDLAHLSMVFEAKRIGLIIIDNTLYKNLGPKSTWAEAMQQFNYIPTPINVSNIQEAIVTWDDLNERWNVEQHEFQVGLNYKENDGVKNLFDSNQEALQEVIRQSAYIERINSFLPKEGQDRILLDSVNCKTCHESSYAVWQNSKHAKLEKITHCDQCHQAGEPHKNFEEWYGLLSSVQKKVIMDDFLKDKNRLVGAKPNKNTCVKCHGAGFDFDSEWLKIKHPPEKQAEEKVDETQNIEKSTDVKKDG